jgi:hypothetical protein
MNIYFYKQKKRVLTNKILEKIHKKKIVSSTMVPQQSL